MNYGPGSRFPILWVSHHFLSLNIHDNSKRQFRYDVLRIYGKRIKSYKDKLKKGIGFFIGP